MRGLLWAAFLVAIALVDARPSKKNEELIEPLDESDRTLIRVARADLEDEEPKVTSHKSHHKKRAKEDVLSRKRRAAEEDEFFQALLSRKEDNRKEKKRSYEESPEDKAYIKRDDWKGDSKISDADRQELESLFSEITSPEEEKEKVEETRSLKPGTEGKIQTFIDWLMSQPPEKFTKSLAHILDTEASLTKALYQEDGPGLSQDQDASSNGTNSTNSGCKPKCYTFKVGGMKCEINCTPPVLEKPTEPPYAAAGMQQNPYMPYPVQAQVPCAPPGCQATQGYPQVPYGVQPQYGAQMPAPVQQAPMQAGCLTGAPACRTGSRKSDEGSESGKDKDKDEEKGEQFPSKSEVNAAQFPIQVQTDPSTYPIMYPGGPVAPLAPVPLAPLAPMPVPSPEAPAQSRAEPAAQSDAGDPRLQPMPKDCQDYSSPECQVFLDWPTDEHNEIKASLRFRQNWDDDYNDKESRRYKMLTTEVEKGITNAYLHNPNFEEVEVTSLSKEDMKVSANFIMRFKQAEYGVLRYLSRAISSNYLQSMPVYRDTLLRDGLKHHHRTIVAKQEELDKVPSKIQDPEPEDPLTTESKAYQGCFRDRKPVRDLPEQFSKYDMTPDWCVGRCKLAGYKFAGLQYAYLCFCGNSFGKYGRALNDKCDSHCFGDSKRFCGSFWHNSVYSVDGRAYNPIREQHPNINGEFEGDEEAQEELDKDEPESEDLGSSDDLASGSGSGEAYGDASDDTAPAAAVANKLMKAAQSALKAAKKLLPHSGKSKRSNSDELEKSKADALAALDAAQGLMSTSPQNARRASERKKREAELQHGKDLLVAYLSDVGGYDREYRDVGDEDENGSQDKEAKVEYRRMVIDESGDGEFIERKIDQKKINRARRRRNLASQTARAFNGATKMASRAVEENAELTKRSLIPTAPVITAPSLVEAERVPSEDDSTDDSAEDSETQSGNDEDSDDSGSSLEEDSDEGESADETEAASDEDGASNDSDDSGSSLDSEGSGNTQESDEAADDQDGEEYGFSRQTRSVESEGATLTRGRRDVEENESDKHDAKETRKSHKREVSLDEQKVATIEQRAKQGVQGLLPIVVGLFKQERRMRAVENFIAALKKNIMVDVTVSQDKEQVLMDQTTGIIKAAAVRKLNELMTSIREEMQEYQTNHPAVNQQAKEALEAILDLPVFQDAVDKLKNRIKKRAVDLEEEYKKVKEGSETLPPILKEHFKRNAPEDIKKESLSRRHRDVKH